MKYFDEVQEQLETLATMDELISGILLILHGLIGETKTVTYTTQAC